MQGLHVQLSPAPGTGLQSPETNSQNRRYRDLSRRQRPHVPHLNPRECPQIAGYSSETGKHRFASDCVVGPGGLEPPTYERMVYYAFDLLHLDGFDTRAAPLVEP